MLATDVSFAEVHLPVRFAFKTKEGMPAWVMEAEAILCHARDLFVICDVNVFRQGVAHDRSMRSAAREKMATRSWRPLALDRVAEVMAFNLGIVTMQIVVVAVTRSSLAR